MSVKLMSAIFDAEFHDLEYHKQGEKRTAKASTCKLVLLAIADHANDYGESAYPGYDRLTTKTALSRQGLSDTLEALEYNGLLSIARKESRVGTNNYTINIRSLPAILKNEPMLVKPLDSDESSHLTQLVKPLDQNHQLTISKPSLAQAPKNSLPMPIENQIYSDIETIELQNDFQKWQAERDIALMKICMFGADLEPLAMAFMDARHMIPATQKQIKSWGAAFREMKKSGVNADHIKRAVEKLSQHGMTIADPWAVDKTARDLCAQPEGYKYDLVY